MGRSSVGVFALALLGAVGAVSAYGRGTPPPVIGLTGYVERAGSEGGGALGQYRCTRTYRDALVRAGAVPVHLLPVPAELVPAAVARLDGLVLCGGPDIDPARYGQSPHPTSGLLDPEREAFDFAVLAEAERRGLPVLGICLGSQELNVHRGGSLLQDIPSLVPGAVGHKTTSPASWVEGAHEIAFVPGTAVARFYPRGTLRVASVHHQASHRVGRGLRVAARAPDGVIEALEDPARPFVVGVQYHPELQPGRHDKLWRAFVAACRARPRP